MTYITIRDNNGYFLKSTFSRFLYRILGESMLFLPGF